MLRCCAWHAAEGGLREVVWGQCFSLFRRGAPLLSSLRVQMQSTIQSEINRIHMGLQAKWRRGRGPANPCGCCVVVLARNGFADVPVGNAFQANLGAANLRAGLQGNSAKSGYAKVQGLQANQSPASSPRWPVLRSPSGIRLEPTGFTSESEYRWIGARWTVLFPLVLQANPESHIRLESAGLPSEFWGQGNP